MKNKLSIAYKILCGALILALLVTGIVFVFTMSDTSHGKKIDSESARSMADEIYGLNIKTDSSYKENIYDYIYDNMRKFGYTNNSKFKLTTQDFDALYNGLSQTGMPYIGKNIVAEINSFGDSGLNSENVSLMIVNYDAGGGANSAMISSMMHTLKYFKDNNASFNNRMIFAFVDGIEGARRLISDYGEFSNYKFIAAFEPLGIGEKIIVSDVNYVTNELLSKLSSLSSIEINSVAKIENPNNLLSMFNLKNMPSVIFSNVENRYAHGTTIDNMSVITTSLINNISSVMIDTSQVFGDSSLQRLHGISSSNLYLSVFDSFILQIPPVLLIVLGVLSIVIFAAIMIINIDLKRYKYKKLLIALGVVVLIFGVVLGLTFAISGLFTAFGIPMFATLYSNMFILFAFLALAGAVSFVCTHFAIKIAKLHVEYIKIASIFLIALVGLVMTFISPPLSYIFIISAFMSSVWLILKMIFPNIFADFSFIYMGLIIIIPMIFPLINTLSIVNGAGVYPYIVACASLLFIACVPKFIQKNFAFNIGKIKVSKVAPILMAGAIAFFAFSLPSSISSDVFSINSNIYNESIAWYYDDAVVFVYDGQKSYAKTADYQVYNHLKSQEDFANNDGNYTFDCDFVIDKKPTITLSSSTISSGVKYKIKIEKAFSDSFYILRIPTFYSDGVKLHLSIESSESMPYNLKDDYIDIILHDNATIEIEYSNDRIELSNVSYREIITTNEYIKNLPQYSKIQNIENLKIYTELNLTV